MSSVMSMRRFLLVLTAAILAVPFVASVCPAQSMVSGAETVTDVIVGRNKKGPYTLSWTDIDVNSLSVVINGRSLRRNKDYFIDTAKGILNFDAVLINDAIVRVSYRIIPGKSRRTGGQMSIPVSLDLLQRQDTSLRVTGLYAQDDPKNPDASKTVVGLGGERRWASGKADSLFLLSQRYDPRGGDDRGDIWSRAGFKFGGEHTAGALKFSGSILHSGTDFAGANEFGLGLGKEAKRFTAEYAPGGPLSASALYEATEDTAGKNKGARSLTSEQSVTYTPDSATRLSLIHSVRETQTAAQGSEKRVDSNVVRLDRKLGERAAAAAYFEDASIRAGDTEDQVQTRSLQLTGSPSSNLSLRGMVSQRFSELYGEEHRFGAGFTATPRRQVKLDVDLGTLENETVGEQTSAQIRVTSEPIPQVAVQAAYSTADSSKLGQASTTDLKLQAKPHEKLELKGTLVENSKNDSTQFQREITLTGTPAEFARVSALFSQKGVDDSDSVIRGASVELTPFSHTRLGAGYLYSDSGSQTLRIRDYSVTAKPWSFFSATGSLRDRELEQAYAPDTASVSVSLAPVRYFTLTGDYQANPEDKKGVIQPHRATSLGLKTRIGSVGISGAFVEKDEYQLDRLSEERRLDLEMPAFGRGALTTGYKIGRFLAGGESTAHTYSLGYRYALGSDLSLSLSGSYTRWLQERMPVPERSEVTAEASLGIRF